MTKSCDVLVLGGGPAGILAALLASSTRQVILAEKPAKEFKLGRRILVSGNGRANFFNADLLKEPNAKALLSYLKNDCGFLYTTEGSLYYPFFNRSECLQEALMAKLKESKVTVLQAKALKVDCQKQEVLLEEANKKPLTLAYHDLVLATGGRSYDRDDFSYELLDSLGVSYLPFSPCLCPIKTCEPIPAYLNHNRLRGLVTLKNGNQVAYQEEGEVLFKDDGLSGIAVFNASLVINQIRRTQEKAPLTLTLDYLSGLKDVKNADTYLPSVPLFLRRYLDEFHLAFGTPLTFTFKALYPFKESQVSYGGILDSQLIPGTLALAKAPTLQVVGEIRDQTYRCGGYNMGHSLLDGYQAGKALEGKL
ncbi:MAG: NAD(P)/FAD-dependent oxidoreductase [Bacilli bacterium]|nr:NAD(P)/FAD-dependent oxidoreductase [Bacilli bacterium]